VFGMGFNPDMTQFIQTPCGDQPFQPNPHYFDDTSTTPFVYQHFGIVA